MIGSQIGSYKILDKLGEGGMGVVYKAVDTSLDRIVAIKALSAELAHNPDLEQRFRAEAKAQANLNHTNIATLYAFLVQDGTAWMVMEYIEGETIADMIQRRGPIPGAGSRSASSSRRCSASATRTAWASCTATSSPATSW